MIPKSNHDDSKYSLEVEEMTTTALQDLHSTQLISTPLYSKPHNTCGTQTHLYRCRRKHHRAVMPVEAAVAALVVAVVAG